MSRSDSKIPAIVLGVGITALGVMRCLAKFGIKSYSADRNIDFVRYSRHYHKPPGATPIGRASELATFLRELHLERAVLMQCGDQWSGAILNLSTELSARFPSSLPTFDLWNILTDKGKLAEFLKKHDIPHPRSIHLSKENGLADTSSLFPGKWFIKPHDSERFFRDYWVKAYEVASLADLNEMSRQLFSDGHDVILQEYIPGPPSNHIFVDGFIDRHGEVRAVFPRQRLRMYPKLFGNSSYMVTIGKSDAQREIDLILTCLQAAGYRGIFSAEFKRDERDGMPRLLEVNTRPWWYIWFAERCGVPIAHMAYLDALENEVPTQHDYSVGTYMVYPFTDTFACLEMVKSKGISILACIRDWLRAKQAVFWICDPFPSIVWFFQEFYRSIKRRFRRVEIRRPKPGNPISRAS